MSSSEDNDNITLNCLIVPCGQLHTFPRDRVVQRVIVGKSQEFSVLAAIQSNLGPPFNNIRLNIRQVYPNEKPMQSQDLISTFLTRNLEQTISMLLYDHNFLYYANFIILYQLLLYFIINKVSFLKVTCNYVLVKITRLVCVT